MAFQDRFVKVIMDSLDADATAHAAKYAELLLGVEIEISDENLILVGQGMMSSVSPLVNISHCLLKMWWFLGRY